MEVMYNEATGPCLVEVGSRCQGGEGTWLPTCVECVGYTQVSESARVRGAILICSIDDAI